MKERCVARNKSYAVTVPEEILVFTTPRRRLVNISQTSPAQKFQKSVIQLIPEGKRDTTSQHLPIPFAFDLDETRDDIDTMVTVLSVSPRDQPQSRFVNISLASLPSPPRVKKSLVKLNLEGTCDDTSQHLQIPLLSDRDEARDDIDTRAMALELSPRDQPLSRYRKHFSAHRAIYLHREPMLGRRSKYLY